MKYEDKIVMVKNLLDGYIYSDKDISILLDISEQEVRDIRSIKDIPNYISNKIIGDGSGIIYYMDIKYDTIVDGEGFRNTVYCSGCNLYCKGCHNKESWKITNGKPITINNLSEILINSKNNVTFSGGECSLQSKAFSKLAIMLKEKNKNIWLYSGNKFEKLLKNINTFELLKNIDVLVDGKFDINLITLDKPFKGSLNQRIIDVKKSFKNNKVELYYE